MNKTSELDRDFEENLKEALFKNHKCRKTAEEALQEALELTTPESAGDPRDHPSRAKPFKLLGSLEDRFVDDEEKDWL